MINVFVNEVFYAVPGICRVPHKEAGPHTVGPTSYLPGKGYTNYPLPIAHNTTLFSLPISASFTTHHLRSYFLLLQVLSLTLCFFVFLFLMGSEKIKKKIERVLWVLSVLSLAAFSCLCARFTFFFSKLFLN